MHLSSCYHPRIINNPYTHERLVVSCGKCPACRDARAAKWVERLNAERSTCNYGVFFTLDYAPEYVPTCIYHDGYFLAEPQKFMFQDKSGKTHYLKRDGMFEQAPYLGKKWLHVLEKSDYVIKYAPSCDIQNFMKRLRKLIKSNGINEKIRYYIVSEYGETTFRPHWHGLLFFNSSEIASRIKEFISTAWKFSRRDLRLSFFETGCSSYVASYVNCLTQLPKYLQSSALRPKAFMSRRPYIGHNELSDEQVRQIFFSSSVTFVRPNRKTQQLDIVPLWRSFKDRYFPRCLQYRFLSSSGRYFLYDVSRFFEKYDDFETYCRRCVESGLCDEVTQIFKRIYDVELYGLFKQIWYTSKKALKLCNFFGVSLSVYLEYLDEFYKRVDYFNLVSGLSWLEEYSSQKYENQFDVIHYYPLEVERILSEPDAPFLGELEKTSDYQVLVHMHDTIEHNNKLTKVKNDYLELHPEFKVIHTLI